MKSRWKGRNVKLESLADKITSFFSSNGFSKKNEISDKDNARILTYIFEGQGKSAAASVVIRGSPDDFEIEFVPNRRGETVARVGILSSLFLLFGSGFFLRGRPENSARFERLEGDFWDIVSGEISKRTGDTKA